MAKFTRYDPRNRKNGRNKDRSLKRDIRIRDVEEHKNTTRFRANQIDWVSDKEGEEEDA